MTRWLFSRLGCPGFRVVMDIIVCLHVFVVVERKKDFFLSQLTAYMGEYRGLDHARPRITFYMSREPVRWATIAGFAGALSVGLVKVILKLPGALGRVWFSHLIRPFFCDFQIVFIEFKHRYQIDVSSRFYFPICSLFYHR